MGMTLSEAEQMIVRARAKRLLLKENYMFQYHQQQEAVRRLIIEEAGAVRVFRANFGFPPLSPSNFRYDRSLGGGALLDCGGYVLKAIEVFFPGSRACVLAASLVGNGSGVDIAGSAMLKVVHGAAEFPAHVAFGFDHRYQCNIEVWGSQARVTTDRTFTAGPGVTPNATIDKPTGVVSIELPADDHFFGILNELAKIVASGSFDAEYEALLRQASLQEAVRLAAVHG
jgi:predicted dehydrogenase